MAKEENTQFFFLADFPHGEVGGHERKNVHDTVPVDRKTNERNREGNSIKICRD